MSHFPFEKAEGMLARWVAFSQKHLYYCPEREGLICYGAGEHGHWGVHTHQKAFSAFAVAAADENIRWEEYGLTRGQVLAEALGMLRFNLETHLTGSFVCSDGERWGHNWIYVLGVERMFHGVEAIYDHLTEHDRQMLRTMLLSECDFLLNEFPVDAGLTPPHNKPESNIWNGATLYRGAMMYPDCPNRAAYIKKAQEFFANGISIESDENSDEIVDGRRIGDMFVGANMFNSYATNHHGYMNVGYMVICLSNIAMLHFSMKARGFRADDIIYHHMKEQWRLIRSLTYDDGRLLRIGGDSRARYCYCQDYLLPSLALVEDYLGEDCAGLENGWIGILEKETAVNGDGSFLSNRFGAFEALSPVYYTRLETDRANVLSMALYWHRLYRLDADRPAEKITSWHDDFHGAAFSAEGDRYASFVWRASEKPQALFLPKEDSSLAEWRYNLCGRILGVGRKNFDEVESHRETMFAGGFLTSGATISYSDDFMAEGQLRETMARKYVAFAALPDGKTALAIQRADALNRTFVASVKGILWNVPNDIFNARKRHIACEKGAYDLIGGDYQRRYETIQAGHWVNADGRVGLCSPQELTIVRNDCRQVEIKGRENSGTLYAEEICSDYSMNRHWADRGATLIDTQFALTLGGEAAIRETCASLKTWRAGGVQAVSVKGKDGRAYVLAANFGAEAAALGADFFFGARLTEVSSGQAFGGKTLEPGEAVLLAD